MRNMKVPSGFFKDFNYPMTVSGIKVNEVVDVSKNDKKMSAGKIRFCTS